MKLVTFQLATPLGPHERIGALDEHGRVVDLAAAGAAQLHAGGATWVAAGRIAGALLPPSMVALIEGGAPSMDAARAALAWSDAQEHDITSEGVFLRHAAGAVKLLAPLPHPPLLRDFMAFETHLKNIYPTLGRAIPPEWYQMPVYYKGNPASIGAHDEDIAIPSYAAELDFEFEFALVIGRGGRNIPREQAMEHVFGYTIYNDFSARAIQGREMAVGLGPAKGKDFARGHVFGPYLLTADDVPNINNLRMQARVNGETWCDSNTATMHWKIPDLIAHASLEEPLLPGEVWGSGTVGNGSGAERGHMLKRGDVVELEMELLGVLRNQVV